MFYQFFLHFVKKPLADELDHLIDSVSAADVETLKTKLKAEIHKLLGV